MSRKAGKIKGTSKSQVELDILVEFLEVAIHNILYVRGIYPSGIFERRRKYNVPVQMSRHPGVNQYISELLRSLQVLLESGEVESVVVAIVNGEQKPVERFVFEMTKPASTSSGEDEYLLRLEQALRGFLLKLNVCDAMLKDVPEGCSWTVQVHTRDSALLNMQSQSCIQDFTWMEADAGQVKLKDAKLLPLKAMDHPMYKMQLYVEEGTKDSS